VNRCGTCARARFSTGDALGWCRLKKLLVLRNEANCNLYLNRDRIEQMKRRVKHVGHGDEIPANAR
jgi:hypothetical protein